MDRLFVASAHQGLGAEARAEQPEAGNLFVFQTNIKGIQDPVFMPELLPVKTT
jgi:sugar lactone lactonase YvrE